MYGDYWKLDRLPFENDCDPQFFYRAPAHESAVLKLQYVVEQGKEIALLVGGHGLGKTYLTRILESELAGQCRPFVRLCFPNLNASQMLALVARRLGADDGRIDESASAAAIMRRLEDRLQSLAAEGARPVLVIDDSQLVDTPHVFQSLALLLSASQVCGLELSLILVGLPELLPQVQRVPALNDRVAVRAALQPLRPDETCEYIRHRLRMCGLETCMFDTAALQSFATLSGGVPRRINQLCDLALLVGFADQRSVISRAEIIAAAEELTNVSLS
jgi:general secretion pathway protein A